MCVCVCVCVCEIGKTWLYQTTKALYKYKSF